MKKVFVFMISAITAFATAQSVTDSGGDTAVGGKKLDATRSDTGGHGQSIDIGKKKDFAFETGETGGYKLPGDGKKVDVATDTGGVVPAGGKKHDLATLDTGDTGGSGATGTIGSASGGTKKLDLIADSRGNGASSGGSGLGKKLDLA